MSAAGSPRAGGISACIVCRNEADRLGPCLESLEWADEIVVMDLESTDGSGSLAAAHGASVILREPLPIVEPLRDEVAARARHDWILAIDPDERVSPDLAVELRGLAARDEHDAVVIPRMNVDLGHAPSSPIQRYEPQLRMYRRDRVRWPLTPNKLPKVPPDRVHRIAADDRMVLVHDRNRTLPEALERAMRYAPAEAEAMLASGRTFTASGMAGAVLTAIDRQVFRARAWEDGVPGLLRALILVNYKVSVWTAFWQASEAGRTADDDRLLHIAGSALDVPWRIGWRLGARLHDVRVRLRRP